MPPKLTDQERYDQVDRPFYEAHIAPILPPAVLDFHTHIWLPSHWKQVPWQGNAPGARYMVTDTHYGIEQLRSDVRMLFPDRSCKVVCFGNPTPSVNLDLTNDYAAEAGRSAGVFPLMVAGKGLTPVENIRQRLAKGDFWGFKVFLNWRGDDYANVCVEDMIGPEEMALADARRLVVLLHVPGAGRLADPQVQKDVQHLALKYPGAQIVLAHCGRCYLPDEMQAAVSAVADLENVYLDTSMVMDTLVLAIALKALGPRRVLFATDLPVARMRGRRVYAMDHWVDLVLEGYPPSAYRVAGDIRATFMAYEIILAIHRAAEQVGLTETELRGIFHDNGMALLERVRRERGGA